MNGSSNFDSQNVLQHSRHSSSDKSSDPESDDLLKPSAYSTRLTRIQNSKTASKFSRRKPVDAPNLENGRQNQDPASLAPLSRTFTEWSKQEESNQSRFPQFSPQLDKEPFSSQNSQNLFSTLIPQETKNSLSNGSERKLHTKQNLPLSESRKHLSRGLSGRSTLSEEAIASQKKLVLELDLESQRSVLSDSQLLIGVEDDVGNLYKAFRESVAAGNLIK